MKIRIEAESHRFTIPLPTGLVLNGFVARAADSWIKRYINIPCTEEQFSVLVRDLKEVKKTFPNLVLVDIKTADDQRVIITL